MSFINKNTLVQVYNAGTKLVCDRVGTLQKKLPTLQEDATMGAFNTASQFANMAGHTFHNLPNMAHSVFAAVNQGVHGLF